jgi:hypothetical protein
MKLEDEAELDLSLDSEGFVKIYPLDKAIDFKEDIVDYPLDEEDEEAEADEDEIFMNSDELKSILSKYEDEEENEEESLMADVILRYVSGRSRLKIHTLKRPKFRR